MKLHRFGLVSDDTEFKKREAEIEKCRKEIAALQDRIKRLIGKATEPAVESSKDRLKSSPPPEKLL